MDFITLEEETDKNRDKHGNNPIVTLPQTVRLSPCFLYLDKESGGRKRRRKNAKSRENIEFTRL